MRSCRVLGHLGALVPRERSTQLLGQCRDRSAMASSNCFGAVTGECRSVLDPGFVPWPSIGGRCSSIVKRVVRSTRVPIAERSRPDDEVAFPVAGHGTIVGFGGSFADHDLGGDELLRLVPCPGPRHAQRPTGAQAGDEFTLECTPALDVERLVDRLVRDPHGLIIGEIHPQPVRRSAPGSTPSPIGGPGGGRAGGR